MRRSSKSLFLERKVAQSEKPHRDKGRSPDRLGMILRIYGEGEIFVTVTMGTVAYLFKKAECSPQAHTEEDVPMTRRPDIEVLRQLPLFVALGPADLTYLQAITRIRSYQRGEIIIVEGGQDGLLCYVRSGVIKLSAISDEGREQILRLVAAGQFFNIVAALAGGPSHDDRSGHRARSGVHHPIWSVATVHGRTSSSRTSGSTGSCGCATRDGDAG